MLKRVRERGDSECASVQNRPKLAVSHPGSKPARAQGPGAAEASTLGQARPAPQPAIGRQARSWTPTCPRAGSDQLVGPVSHHSTPSCPQTRARMDLSTVLQLRALSAEIDRLRGALDKASSRPGSATASPTYLVGSLPRPLPLPHYASSCQRSRTSCASRWTTRLTCSGATRSSPACSRPSPRAPRPRPSKPCSRSPRSKPQLGPPLRPKSTLH